MSKTASPPWRFRSLDEWKASILTLPDNACFDLLRSVFGNIKTPFNKHQLMEKLAAFLSRREIQDTIAAYINDDDRRIIAAIALLGEPAAAELENFFTGEYSGAEVHGLLLNLEERLIVYRFREEGGYRISLNPLLEPALSPFIADTSVLFPSISLDKDNDGNDDGDAARTARYPFDDRALAAIIAFIAARGEAQKEFFKTGGGIRKKIIDDGRRIFPDRDIEVFVEALRSIGLLETDGERLAPESQRLVFFGKLSFRERLEYLASGIFTAAEPVEHDSWYFRRGRIQNLARFIRRFTEALDPRRLYPRRTLFRLAEILERDSGVLIQGGGRQPSPGTAAGETGRFLAALETVGLLRAVLGIAGERSGETVYAANFPPGKGRGQAAPPPGDRPPENRDGGDTRRPLIAMDTPFSCILYPEIDFSGAVTLASFCDCRETGAAVRFELTRESAVRGFDRGLKAEDMIGILERLSLGAPDQNLIWTLKDWENRYLAVSLFQGTVLTLSEDRRYLAETKMLSRLISRTFAPGVYLLSVSGKDEAAHILQKAGVDIIAQPPVSRDEDGGLSARSPYPSVAAFDISGKAAAVPVPTAALPDREKAAKAQKEKFHGILRKSGLSKPDQAELAARIERRQIVSESQLTEGAARHEKTEARNLDYAGKTIIAKQAISSGSLVEILLPSAGGGENRILGTPRALEKSGGETVLVLHTSVRDGGGEELRIPLGKISLLRWIKQSIFTG
jgi:hypothetical protein